MNGTTRWICAFVALIALIACNRPATDEPAPVEEAKKSPVEVKATVDLDEPPVEESKVVEPELAKVTDPTDHNETNNDESFKEAKGRVDATSDAQMQGKFNNAAIGAGAAGGARFGGRRGGRMNLARRGGGGRATEPRPTESYDTIKGNTFKRVGDHPLSTFSIDVDTASYANVRRILTSGQMPPSGAVRIEEMINYFSYDYGKAKEGQPFAVDIEVAGCPWNTAHRVVRIGLQAPKISAKDRPASNLVFLLDVSGSMNRSNKLPLLIEALELLVNNLAMKDRVAIAVYAGASGLVLPPTSIAKKHEIIGALRRLRSGGSTNGGAGIRLAYSVARQSFIKGGNNRVILCTDGDFNVGTTSRSELTKLIEAERKSGVFLSVLGFGSGNYKDSTMEELSNKGNGNYAYIDTIAEARKVLVEQMGGTLVAVAKDVKIQVEFNPGVVAAYKLIGYENRMLEKEDFNNDKKDAGEIGAGHTVTALYEVVPAKSKAAAKLAKEMPPEVDALKYQKTGKATGASEMLTVKLRYKKPDGDTSTKLEYPVTDKRKSYRSASPDFKFALAVAELGLILRDGEKKAGGSFDAVVELASAGLSPRPNGPRPDLAYRKELIELAKKAKRVAAK